MYHDMGGEAWRIKVPHLKTPKNVTITATLTNANAKPVKGNYKKIYAKAMKELMN